MIYHIFYLFLAKIFEIPYMDKLENAFDKTVALGQRFREYRKALGISQQDVHRKTGVALSTISLFENGKGQGLSLSYFFLLMDALELELAPNELIPDAFRSDLAKQWEKQNKHNKQ